MAAEQEKIDYEDYKTFQRVKKILEAPAPQANLSTPKAAQTDDEWFAEHQKKYDRSTKLSDDDDGEELFNQTFGKRFR